MLFNVLANYQYFIWGNTQLLGKLLPYLGVFF